MKWLKAKAWHTKEEGGLHSQNDKDGRSQYGIWYYGDVVWFDIDSDTNKAIHGYNFHRGYAPRLPVSKDIPVNIRKETQFRFCIEDLDNGSTAPRWYFHKYDGHYGNEPKRAIPKPTMEEYLALSNFGIF